MLASCEGFPVLDGAVLPDVLSPDVGVGREEGREDGGLGPLVDGERALKQHMNTLEGGAEGFCMARKMFPALTVIHLLLA